MTSNFTEVLSEFRLARCNDLIRLKARYSDMHYHNEHSWGLKQMGTLYCYDRILKLKPKNVLEVGTGLKNFFDINIGQRCNLFSLDDDSFYGSDKFNKAVEKRKNTTHLFGYLGKSSDKLPNSFFDTIFSISVLEHIPEQDIPVVFAEMSQIMKKGGWMFSSIDIFGLDKARTLIPIMYEALIENGFMTSDPGFIIWSAEDADPVLLEPLSIVYNYYYRKKDNPWQNPAFVKSHAVTYIVSAYKI